MGEARWRVRFEVAALKPEYFGGYSPHFYKDPPVTAYNADITEEDWREVHRDTEDEASARQQFEALDRMAREDRHLIRNPRLLRLTVKEEPCR